MEKPLESPELSYDPLNNYFNNPLNKTLKCYGYRVDVLVTNKDFIGFNRMELPMGECADGKIYKKYGLKFHVSLPEYDPEMYKKGWDIVRNTLIRHQVDTFKIIRSNRNMSAVVGQEGKDITIYADAEPGRTNILWQAVLEDITKNLVEGGVKPGYRAPGTKEKPEKPVNGSNYITYRYFDEWKKTSKWPNPDPCNSINVKVQGQPDIPVLVRQKTNEKQERKSQEFK